MLRNIFKCYFLLFLIHFTRLRVSFRSSPSPSRHSQRGSEPAVYIYSLWSKHVCIQQLLQTREPCPLRHGRIVIRCLLIRFNFKSSHPALRWQIRTFKTPPHISTRAGHFRTLLCWAFETWFASFSFGSVFKNISLCFISLKIHPKSTVA